MQTANKLLSDWARDYYDGVIDQDTYQQHRAEILDNLEDQPLVDMDATLPLAQRVAMPEAKSGEGRAISGPAMFPMKRMWPVTVLLILILVALLARYFLSA